VGQHQLNKNIFSGSITAAMGIVLSIISYPIYLHFLGANLYGLWIIVSVVISFSAIGALGIDEAIVKYVAQEYGKNNKENILKYISTSINFLVICGILIIAILMSLKDVIRGFLNLGIQYSELFYAIFPFIVILSVFIYIVNLINSVLKGLGRFDQASYFLLGGRIIAISIAIVLLTSGYSIWSLYWGQLLSFIFVLIISAIFIYRKIGAFYNPWKFEVKSFWILIKFGGTLTLSKVISMLLVPFVKIVIVRYIGLSDVAYFEIAHKIVLQIRSLFERGISAIMPEISRLTTATHNQEKEISRIMFKAYNLILFFGLPTFILLIFVGDTIIKAWLATEYNVAISTTFKIIAIGFTLNLLIIPIYYHFMALGKVKYCFYNHLVQAVLNFGFISLLLLTNIIDYYLFVVSFAVSVGVSALVLLILYCKNIGAPFKHIGRFAGQKFGR
jgi:O-antigen/teichoic acid export membrane protein